MFTPKLTVLDTTTGKITHPPVTLAGGSILLPLMAEEKPHRITIETKAINQPTFGPDAFGNYPPLERSPTPLLQLPVSWKGECHFTAILFENSKGQPSHVFALACEKEASPPEELRKKFLGGAPTGLAFQMLSV